MKPTIVSQPAVEVQGIYLSITFIATLDTYRFVDAIVGSPEFINGLTADELYAMELKRFEDWYAIVTAPPPKPIAPEGFEFVLDKFNTIVRDQNGDPVLVATGENNG
jgi:hypothetical protein